MPTPETVARRLFPDDVFEEQDCRQEVGREGQTCRVCAEFRQRWLDRIDEVRKALEE
jgi:hypothetical protein